MTPEKELEIKLKELSDLYEEAKNCADRMFTTKPQDECARLLAILRDMRNIAAVEMQKVRLYAECN